jgi:hypothetical protein
MKNIYILPINKPSRLHLGNSGLVLCDLNFNPTTINPQHIYITNLETPKAGDYTINIDNELVQLNQSTCIFYDCKIILTNDPKLIKDGVQSIDDEFLEWFVKNPSCEFVEFNAYPISPNGNIVGTDKLYPFDGLISNFRIDYKIIIPKEEHKQETLEEAVMSYLNRTYSLSYERTTVKKFHEKTFSAGAKWQEKQLILSDEEITKIAYDYILYNDIKRQWVIEGMKLYREQFKKK